MRDAQEQLYNRANVGNPEFSVIFAVGGYWLRWLQLLFELRTEERPHVNAQGAVLLTYYESPKDPQAGSLWVTRAIEHAMLIDSHPPLVVGNVAISLKKRLWWSILLRDQSLCIGLRHRPRVTSIGFHGWSDWLSIEDFSEELHQSRVYNYDTKKRLLVELQNQCELAVVLTDLDILEKVWPTSWKWEAPLPKQISLGMTQYLEANKLVNFRIKVDM